MARSPSPGSPSRGRQPARQAPSRTPSESRSRSSSYSRSRPRSYSRSPARSYSRSRLRSPSRTRYKRSYRSRTRSDSRSPMRHSDSRLRSRSVTPSQSRSRPSSPLPAKRQRQDFYDSRRNRRRSPRPRALPDVDRRRAHERARQAENRPEPEVKPFDPKEEYQRLLNLRSGGTYVPPARLRALQSQMVEKNSQEYQRLAWENLKKGINGLINKVNKANIREIVQEIFNQNLVRGRGLFARSIMRAQGASLPYTPIYAAIAAIINTKLPQIGELLVARLVIQFRKAYRRNDKPICISSTMFLAHLCNYQIAHEIIALQLLHLLLERPTDDSVEIAVGFMKEVGAFLSKVSSAAHNGVYERFRAILHEAQLEPRTQYMIETLFLVRKNDYKDNPEVAEELDLVEEDDQITHMIGLDDELVGQDNLNVFRFDPEYDENEEKYKAIRDEILGGDEDDDETGSESGDSEGSSEDEAPGGPVSEQKKMEIQDMTNKNLVNLRRTIYLTIRSSMDFEECCHKLLRIKLVEGQEIELVNMIIECCSQEKIYSKFYGLVAERFCKINRFWRLKFMEAFTTYYDTIHRYETNKIRNIAIFFGHVLATDAMPWDVLACVHLNEDETNASSRIFLKIIFQSIVEEIGMKALIERFNDPNKQGFFEGLFPRNDPVDTRFSIHFFTAIGLGAVTEPLREFLSKAMELAKAQTSSDH
ncbi:pre-mRNA-splicing factor CWC22 [Lipomyces arxii]|uniref:pre-mRNA-splicing factor CWC22 n=1 Tax=Lipomyces arxii TaxID=56418 RepID=UPI0034CEB490